MVLHSALGASGLIRPQVGVLRLPGQLEAPCRSSRYVGRHGRTKTVTTVAKAAGDTDLGPDLGALFADALKTGSAKGTSAAESAGNAASKAVEQAPAAGSAVERVAGSGLQPLQDPQQAGSAAKQALNSAGQAASNAAKQGPPPAQPAAKQALSLTKQAAESAAQSKPSPPPPAGQQAAESVVQSTKEQASSALQTAQHSNSGGGGGSATSQAARALSEKASSAPPAGSGGGAVEQGLSATDVAPSSGPDALSQLTDGVQSTVTATQDTAADVMQTIKGAAASLLDGGKGATSGLLDSTSSLREAADSGLAAAQSTASGLLSGMDDVKGGVQGQASQLLSTVQAATAELTTSANSAAAGAVEALPPPVREALLQAKGVASQVATQVTYVVSANPEIAKAAAVPLIGGSALIWFVGRFAGYKGPLPPSKAYNILQEEDALLVDIRSDAERAAQGLPDLQRNALGKGATVPLDAINTAPASKLRRAQQVSTDVVALTISQLRAVRGGTKVILMDRGDGRAVPIAKRLNKFGVRSAFVVEGGFRQWQRDMAVRDDRSDYSASQLQLLGSRTSMAAEETATALGKPSSVALCGAALVLAAGVLIDWRRTLQYIGTGGLLFTALLRTTSYSRPQDLLDDISNVSNTVGAPFAAITGTTKVLARKVQNAASGDSGPAEVLTQPVQPTQPVSEVAAGRAQEEPVKMPDVDTGSGSEGSNGGSGGEKQAAQLR